MMLLAALILVGTIEWLLGLEVLLRRVEPDEGGLLRVQYTDGVVTITDLATGVAGYGLTWADAADNLAARRWRRAL
jgi:hypothetical protein